VRLIVSPAATADLQRLYTFLAGKNEVAAQHATAVLENAMQSLATFPERGRPVGDSGLREVVVPFGRSAYIVRYGYLAQSDEVVIVRIWHGRELRE
jgi:plasmid stabilization system protein ParE